MFDWIKSMVHPAQPRGLVQTLRAFGPNDETINQDSVKFIDDAFVVETDGEASIRLFDIHELAVDNCMLTYRAALKTEAAAGRIYLEMWCRFTGRGEFFSRGDDQAVKGDNDWATYEVRFFLKAGQIPDLVKLNLVLEGKGKVRIRNIELTCTPFESRESVEDER